jgi:hypothetical protein
VYGQGHRWCENCGHAVRYGHPRCSGCGTGFGELMMLDLFMDRGYGGGGIEFDPLDGQFGFEIPGTDIVVEQDGQIGVDPFDSGFDFPV